MSYKTILVHADHSRQAAARIRIAASLAIAADAHLIGAAMTGISRFAYEDEANVLLSARIDTLCKHAQDALAAFDGIARQMAVHSYEQRLIGDDPAGGLVLQARYSDLVIVSQANPQEFDPTLAADLPEYVALHSVRPVLIIPHTGQFDRIGDNILVAWDGSMQATRAITQAIPLLKQAARVTIASFNPAKQTEMQGQLPEAEIVWYLARHRIQADISQQECEKDIGHALMSLAAEQGADLIVMGAYGHMRFREILLGGVTATMLRDMTLPVLMSH